MFLLCIQTDKPWYMPVFYNRNRSSIVDETAGLILSKVGKQKPFRITVYDLSRPCGHFPGEIVFVSGGGDLLKCVESLVQWMLEEPESDDDEDESESEEEDEEEEEEDDDDDEEDDVVEISDDSDESDEPNRKRVKQ